MRVSWCVRKVPSIELVSARLFCFSTPRISMHMCWPRSRRQPQRRDLLVDGLRNLRRQPLLYLQAAAEHLHKADHLADADDLLVRQVGNVDLAEERQEVVFTRLKKSMSDTITISSYLTSNRALLSTSSTSCRYPPVRIDRPYLHVPACPQAITLRILPILTRSSRTSSFMDHSPCCQAACEMAACRRGETLRPESRRTDPYVRLRARGSQNQMPPSGRADPEGITSCHHSSGTLPGLRAEGDSLTPISRGHHPACKQAAWLLHAAGNA